MQLKYKLVFETAKVCEKKWDLTEEEKAEHPLQNTHCLYELLPLSFSFSHPCNLEAIPSTFSNI